MVGILGVGACALLGRVGWALGFAVGAALSLGNFHLIVQAVTRFSGGGAAGRPRAVWKGSIFRLGIAAAVLFGALVFLRLPVLAVALGLVVVQLQMIGAWILKGLRVEG